MSGTVGAAVRVVAIGTALALSLLLLAAREATAAKYSVAQCGWHIGADAGWADSTGGVKFRPDAWCVPPAGANPFDGVHMKSFTRSGHTSVSGTRFARWRWEAPPTTGIVKVNGTWWQTLHDGMQQRFGAGTAAGGFEPFAIAAGTDVAPREFGAGFTTPQPAIEDRLLCARAESKWCSLEKQSWSSVRALTITVQDDTAPAAGLAGSLTDGGWRRGAQGVSFSAADAGSGVRFGETFLDWARVVLHEYPCAKAMIGGEWRGTKMQPCATSGSAAAGIDTTRFSDGGHTLSHCATDFAGNVACAPARTVHIDNNPPAHPRNLTLAGGEEWRRVNDFDFSWVNPEQAPASPIGGALWRIVGPAGYDSGVKLAAGREVAAIADRTVPGAGTYVFRVWLRDEAGNDAPGTAIERPMRFDDVPPGVAFGAVEDGGGGFPTGVRADVHDAHSGPASGEIFYRRLNAASWEELPAKFVAGTEGRAQLTARLPESLAPGTYVFRAEVLDAAGNRTVGGRRIDGTEMALRKVAPPVAENRAARGSSAAAKTRLFAVLRWRGRRGTEVTVPFGAGAMLSGRLVTAEGAGLAGRRLRIVARPSRGAVARRRVEFVETGGHGGFRLSLPGGPSRRITVGFAGDGGLAGSRRAGLGLRVAGAVSLSVGPKALGTGESLRLWGRVRLRGAAIPRRGKLVAIQYYEREARSWRPVLVTRSDHGGRFRARYRFRYVSGTAEIRLRAVALAEERWPYAPGASRPAAVRVSGRSG